MIAICAHQMVASPQLDPADCDRDLVVGLRSNRRQFLIGKPRGTGLLCPGESMLKTGERFSLLVFGTCSDHGLASLVSVLRRLGVASAWHAPISRTRSTPFELPMLPTRGCVHRSQTCEQPLGRDPSSESWPLPPAVPYLLVAEPAV